MADGLFFTGLNVGEGFFEQGGERLQFPRGWRRIGMAQGFPQFGEGATEL